MLLERTARLGGQMALTRDAPGAAEIGRRLVDLFEGRLEGGGVDVRLDTEADVRAVLEHSGPRPSWWRRELVRSCPLSRWTAPRSSSPGTCWPRVLHGLRIVVADWGADPSGLDVAEVLALAGNDVTLAVASVTAGEAVHQYRRNLYLQRLYRAGVDVRQHRALAGASAGFVELANVFAPELRERVPADLLVLAQGRVPEDELAGGSARQGYGSKKPETASRPALSRRRSSRARLRLGPFSRCHRLRVMIIPDLTPEIHDLKAAVGRFVEAEVYPLEARIAERGSIDPDELSALRSRPATRASQC